LLSWREYLIDPNATQAAIRAGYSPARRRRRTSAANEIGRQNLTKLDIAAAIKKAQSKRAERFIAAAIEKAQAKRAERCELTIFADESRDHHVVVPRVPGIGRELR
jgi:phage terminase small subunit